MKSHILLEVTLCVKQNTADLGEEETPKKNSVIQGVNRADE